MLYLQLPLVKPYIRFSRIRLSDHLLPEAFALAWPSGIVSSEVPESWSFQHYAISYPSLLRKPMKALPLPSPKVVLSLRSKRYYGQLRLPYRPNGISYPYIHLLPPCMASVRASRATPHGFSCVSPLLPRKSICRFWQFSLGQTFQPSPPDHRVGNSIHIHEATHRFASAATRRFARLTL
jgi:hypothetical protein